ncbi:MAG: excinuclease ABC subunit UvrC [bacterium]|nr:excinuclease ABC subunit UvrC [bacterium]
MESLTNFIKKAPVSPGCYIMKNVTGDSIYIGKAKNIRKRLTSYTRAEDEKTRRLVRGISDIEYIVTDTESEALILEAQLIQKHHPKYNIDLQTPGRYAFIKITDEDYPRLEVARKVEKKGTYVGPYPSAAARNAALQAAYRIFKLCKVKKPRGARPCFRYYFGVCSGPCARLISKEEYGASVKQAIAFLRGDAKKLIDSLKKEMTHVASQRAFEKAKLLRDQISALEKIEHQNVSAPKSYDQDVINYLVHSSVVTIQVFHFHKGIISGRKEYRFSLDATMAGKSSELFQDFLCQYYASQSVPREVIIPELLTDQKTVEEYLEKISGIKVALVIPQKGIKKKLLDMVFKNLLLKIGKEGDRLSELQKALHLKEVPMVIDCVDISTLSGTNSVGSLVQCINGQPAKSGYRKFTIKTVAGMNDFAMIFEVIIRFGKRVLEGKEKRPDLLVIDGGRGQLNAAMKALSELNLDIPTIGLAKRLEEVYVSWAPHPLHISPRSSALQLLQALRDEAHRFAITFQRKKRRLQK